jgi:sn-glycerol 3-phosphate transport system ATP-binding protein
MNLIPGRVTDNGRTLARDGDLNLRLPEPRPSLDGRSVLLGVRPEHLETCDESTAAIRPDIDFIELLGSDSLVYGHLGADKQGARVAARLHTSHIAREGHLPLRFDAEHMHLFDPENGRRIEG